MMDRTIFHIDVNSAFLSWSAVKLLEEGGDIDIRLVPAIIGGDQDTRHGIVLAKSVPAKKFDIQTAEPVASALKKYSNLYVVKPDMAYYRKQSHRFIDLLSEFTDQIEQVSVDECYVDMTDIVDDFKVKFGIEYPKNSMQVLDIANFIRELIKEKLGFTVNVGISNCKLLAKMASDFKKPDLCHTLYPDEIEKKMWPLPIGDLFMVGKASEKVLRTLGINTIGELAKTPLPIIESHLKSHGRNIWEFANGIDDSPVTNEESQVKGVGNSTTVSQDITQYDEASAVLKTLSSKVSGRLKKRHQKASMVSVEIKYSDFSKSSHQTMVKIPLDGEEDIHRIAMELFDSLWTGEPLRLLGIRTSKLTDREHPVQISMFEIM